MHGGKARQRRTPETDARDGRRKGRLETHTGNAHRKLPNAGNFRRVLVSISVEVDNAMSTPRALE
jgi:hypothetical protein